MSPYNEYEILTTLERLYVGWDTLLPSNENWYPYMNIGYSELLLHHGLEVGMSDNLVITITLEP